MNALDFLNSSPHYFIFKKETNKTNFGGVLFLIYLIIMFFISFIYILDFAWNDKYEVTSIVTSADIQFYEDETGHMAQKGDPFLNIYEDISFQLALYPINEFDEDTLKNMDNNLLLKHNDLYYKSRHIDEYTPEHFFFDFKINLLESNDIDFYYKCDDYNCSNFPFDFDSYVGMFIINTKDFVIDHNAPNPIKTSYCAWYGAAWQCHSTDFSDMYSNATLEINLDLFPLIYEEKKGISRIFDKILKRENRHSISVIGDTIKDYNDLNIWEIEYEEEEKEYNYEEEYNPEVGEDYYKNATIKNKYYHLAKVHINFPTNYQLYQRKKIEFLDVLAKIGALFSTFNTVFAFIFKFYSKNIDNYKIVEKILQNNASKENQFIINNKRNNIQMELINLNLEKENIISPLLDIKKEKEEEKNEEEYNNININKTDSKNHLDEEKNVVNPDKKILPKFSFFDFYINNLYFKKCKRRKRQDILNICNNIVSKYISIDHILDNLLKFENLLKDYKWNNPSLNNLDNIDLITDLKKYL